MDALLSALETSVRSRAPRYVLAGTAIVASAAIIGLVLQAGSSTGQPCEKSARQLDGIWDPAIRAHFVAGLSQVDAKQLAPVVAG